LGARGERLSERETRCEGESADGGDDWFATHTQRIPQSATTKTHRRSGGCSAREQPNGRAACRCTTTREAVRMNDFRDDAYHEGTQLVRAGMNVPRDGASFQSGVVFASSFHFAGDPADSPYTYGRYHNPTWTGFEEALALLDGGPCVLFGSGMAAVAAVFGALLDAGDTVLIPNDVYHATRRIAHEDLERMGVVVRSCATDTDAIVAHLDGVKLVWVESPTNPKLDVVDIRRLCNEAHARGVLVAVDNTTATAYLQKPLALGADLVVASDTKALTGHGDLLLGHVGARDPELVEKMRGWRLRMGAIAGPMETWLAHRSLPTLDVRLERQCASAQRIAEYLAAHDAVEYVRYPGLASDPSHAIAATQMSAYGTIISFVLRDAATVDRFLGAARLVANMTSFGAVHTSAERRKRWGGDDIPDGFVRMSIGVERLDDLLTDIDAALARAEAVGGYAS
jgi:cystathionine gamma-lyase